MVKKFFHLFLPYQYNIQPLGCSLYRFLEDGPIRWIKKVWRTDMELNPWDWAQSVQITQKFPGLEAWYPQATVRFPPNLKLQLPLHDSGLLMLVDQQANSDCSEYPEELGCSTHDEQGRVRLKFTEFTMMYFGASIENA